MSFRRAFSYSCLKYPLLGPETNSVQIEFWVKKRGFHEFRHDLKFSVKQRGFMILNAMLSSKSINPPRNRHHPPPLGRLDVNPSCHSKSERGSRI